MYRTAQAGSLAAVHTPPDKHRWAHLSHFGGDTLKSSTNMMISQSGWWLDLSCVQPGLMRRSSSLSQASVAGQARFRLAPCIRAGRLECLDTAELPLAQLAGRPAQIQENVKQGDARTLRCDAGALVTGSLQQGDENALGTPEAQHEPHASVSELLHLCCLHTGIQVSTLERHVGAHGNLFAEGGIAEP